MMTSDREAKLLYVFKMVHGELTGGCRVNVIWDYNIASFILDVTKAGRRCWYTTVEELTFDYATMNLGDVLEGGL